jgi:hypothetical protein
MANLYMKKAGGVLLVLTGTYIGTSSLFPGLGLGL